MDSYQEIRQRLAKIQEAQREGWRWVHDAPGCVAEVHPSGGKQTVCTSPGLLRRHAGRAESDAEFIANAPEDIATLLAEVDRLQKESRQATANRLWMYDTEKARADTLEAQVKALREALEEAREYLQCSNYATDSGDLLEVVRAALRGQHA